MVALKVNDWHISSVMELTTDCITLCTRLVKCSVYQTPPRLQIFPNAIPKGSVFRLFQPFISTKSPISVFE